MGVTGIDTKAELNNMANKIFNDINLIYDSSNKLSPLKNMFQLLDELNFILKQAIPQNLAKICHVGAVDKNKNLVVLYVDEQEAIHILKNMCDHILQSLVAKGFSFDGVLIKTRPHSEVADQLVIKYKKLSPSFKDKLRKLATAIEKPEIVVETEVIDAYGSYRANDDEINLS